MLKAVQRFWQRVSSGPRERQSMAFLRIATGLFFLYEGHHKLTAPQFEAQWLGQLNTWAATNPFPLYKAFLQQGVLPHFHQIANFITDVEILIGVSYVTGFLVPVGAGLAIVLSLNLLLASQHTGPELLGLNLLLLLVSFVLFWGRAGKQFGLDQFFSFSLPAGYRKGATVKLAKGKTKARKPVKVQTASWCPKKMKPQPAKAKRKAMPPLVSAERENVRKFERPERPAKPPSANVRKLEKVLKQETRKQKQQEIPAKPEPKSEKTPPAISPAPENPPENLKVVKIFDHRTPDDDD